MINPSRAAQPADRSAVAERHALPRHGNHQTPKTIWLELAAPCSFAAISVKLGIVSEPGTNEKTPIAFCTGRDCTASRSRNGLPRARESADRTFLSHREPIAAGSNLRVRFRTLRGVKRCSLPAHGALAAVRLWNKRWMGAAHF